MPRKTLKQRKEKYPTENEINRIRSVMDNIIGMEVKEEIPEDQIFKWSMVK